MSIEGYDKEKTMNILFRSVVLSLLCVSLLFAELVPSHADEVMKTIHKYRRDYTVLEIGKGSCKYLTELPLSSHVVGAAVLLAGDADAVLEKIGNTRPQSISLMAPPKFTLTMLDTLGRCEHFDIVIVHDISSCVQAPLSSLIAALTRLGDALFIEAENPAFEKLLNKSTRIKKLVDRTTEYPALFALHTKKKGLDLARYTQQKSRSTKPRYEVTSSYIYKEFNKKGLDYPLKWIHGINLVTFVMFYGVYPTDIHIRKEIRRLRKIYSTHNDFVIGNLILRGKRLFPIDIGDTRRSADFTECVALALRYFKEGNSRLKNPQAWIDRYYNDIA